MRWYLNIDDNNYGPYDEAQILQMIQAGQVRNDWIAAEGGEWTSVDSHPPFAQALAARGGALLPLPPPQQAGSQAAQQPGGGGQPAIGGGQPEFQAGPGPGAAAQGGQGQQGVDPDLLKTIPFQDAGEQLASMQDWDGAMPQGAPYQQGQSAPAPQQGQVAPAPQQVQAAPAPQQAQAAPAPQQAQAPPPAQQVQTAPPPSQLDPVQLAPSDQIDPPSFGKAIVIAGVILAGIIGVGVLLQILIGPGF